MTLSMLIAYCSKPYQVTDPEYTKKSHLRIVFGEKMYEIERVTLIEIIIFTLIAVTALQKRQLKTLAHNADATHEFRIEKQHKLMISL